MSMDRAPDAMPTPVIEQMIENAEKELRDWRASKQEHIEGFERAVRMEMTIDRSLQQLNWWMKQRQEEEGNEQHT